MGCAKGPWSCRGTRCRVAVFFTEDAAAEYLHKSLLKKPTDLSAFRKTSLLWGAHEAEIELVEALGIEQIEPKI